ncbi:hypothetical protein AZE42_12657 [Rhizopogon vesiculosus]|uniref:Uncharacterized protein n=1 Tax=Rhizopogon vesiculosus TaxID=180088 RepID=A0A1J8PY41_9AGAM|nr:hypothetical protein AZE42_12657 [Rhizopogon vesiculosus]
MPAVRPSSRRSERVRALHQRQENSTKDNSSHASYATENNGGGSRGGRRVGASHGDGQRAATKSTCPAGSQLMKRRTDGLLASPRPSAPLPYAPGAHALPHGQESPSQTSELQVEELDENVANRVQSWMNLVQVGLLRDELDGIYSSDSSMSSISSHSSLSSLSSISGLSEFSISFPSESRLCESKNERYIAKLNAYRQKKVLRFLRKQRADKRADAALAYSRENLEAALAHERDIGLRKVEIDIQDARARAFAAEAQNLRLKIRLEELKRVSTDSKGAE